MKVIRFGALWVIRATLPCDRKIVVVEAHPDADTVFVVERRRDNTLGV
jgi:hypothetical protein